MNKISEIIDHAQIVDINGEYIGIVDHLKDENNIKLAKSESNVGGQHHVIPMAWVKA